MQHRTIILSLAAGLLLVGSTCMRGPSTSRGGLTSGPMVLVARDLLRVDQAGGVDQASPGVANSPTGPNPYQESGGALVVPHNAALFRWKIFDHPATIPHSNGLLHFLLEFDQVGALLAGLPADLDADGGQVELFIDRVEVFGPRGSGLTKRTYRPSGSDRRTVLVAGSHFWPVIRGISIPAGNYARLRVHFRSEGRLTLGGESYSVRVPAPALAYDRSFTVEAGRVTTLHAQSGQERLHERRKRKGQRQYRDCRMSHWRSKKPRIVFLALKPITLEPSTIHDPVTKIFIRMNRMEAVQSTGAHHLLNDTPTEFELLSLRDGAVALMSHSILPPGTYSHFEVKLGNGHHVETGGVDRPLVVEEWSNDVLRMTGPVELRGGIVTEAFLHFDPSRSVFFLGGDRGFLLDPFVEVTSLVSMTAGQYGRVVQALGARSNQVLAESEVIIEGLVTGLTSTGIDRPDGSRFIYTDATISISEKLRGEVAGTISLRLPGGSVGELRLDVADMPTLQMHERAILFLRSIDERWAFVRGSLGKVSLASEATSGSDAPRIWDGPFPRVSFALPGTLQGLFLNSEEEVRRRLGSALEEWTFARTGARLGTLGGGRSLRTLPYGPPVLDCSASTSAKFSFAGSAISEQTAPDADCTAPICTFLWSCPDLGLQLADVRLNSADHAWALDGAASDGRLHAVGYLLHAIGHAAGLGHCLPGDTEAMCSARGTPDPPPESIMHRLMESLDGRTVAHQADQLALIGLYGPLTQKEGELAAETRQFLVDAEAFCREPCLAPHDETNPRYAVSTTENSDLQRHALLLVGKEEATPLFREFVALNTNLLYQTALFGTQIPAERYMLRAIHESADRITKTAPEILPASRSMLTVQIGNRKNLLAEHGFAIDPGFARFTQAEIRVLIELRRRFIDEMIRRGMNP